jgi:hypothetical protein
MITKDFVISIFIIISAATHVTILCIKYPLNHDEEENDVADIEAPPSPTLPLRYKFIEVSKEIPITCPLCIKTTNKYLVPNHENKKCTCIDFTVCEECISKLRSNKCPFCRLTF